MFQQSVTNKNKNPKVQPGHYLTNSNEPLDDVDNDLPIKAEIKLSESSPIMRQRFRSIAARLRNRPSQLLKPTFEVANNHIQASEEQLRRELYYIELTRIDGVEVAELNVEVALLEAKFNARRKLLGLSNLVSTK